MTRIYSIFYDHSRRESYNIRNKIYIPKIKCTSITLDWDLGVMLSFLLLANTCNASTEIYGWSR